MCLSGSVVFYFLVFEASHFMDFYLCRASELLLINHFSGIVFAPALMFSRRMTEYVRCLLFWLPSSVLRNICFQNNHKSFFSFNLMFFFCCFSCCFFTYIYKHIYVFLFPFWAFILLPSSY